MQLFADLERIPSSRKHIRDAALVNSNVLITDKCPCLMWDLAHFLLLRLIRVCMQGDEEGFAYEVCDYIF